MSSIYCLSSELNPNWSAPFAPQSEILKYWGSVAHKYNIDSQIQFNTAVKHSVWDASIQAYQVTVQNAVTNEESVLTFEVLISAVGALHWPNIPKDPRGVDDFKGQVFHTAKYRHDVKLQGKRVGVIGNGASGCV